MGFGDAVRGAFSKYAVFDGRATRPEFWWFVLFSFLVQLAGAMVDGFLLSGTLFGPGTLLGLALFLPTITVTARRLHDTDLSGWWQLIAFVPAIGAIALIVLCCRRGTPDANRFGAPPSLPRADVLAG